MVERRRRRGRLAHYENPVYVALVERVAANVRALREARGVTQQEAADRAELSLRLWQAIEGADSNLTLVTLARVCGGLDVDAAELFARVANPGRARKRGRGRPKRFAE